ncbi:MAG: hypothetical protein ABJN40_02985 [Sneathiella sp.]
MQQFSFLSLLMGSTLLLSPSLLSAEEHNHGSHDHNHSSGEAGFYGHLDVKIHLDDVFDAEESDEEISEAYTHSHFETGYRFGNGFSVNANIELEGEPAGHSHHGGGGGEPDGSNLFFDNHDLIIRDLNVRYESEHFGLLAGKFTPVVGFDYHLFPGIYGYQAIEEYAVREKIGIGGALKLDAGDFGRHRLDASTFFADTTFLSGSLINERDTTDEDDGGVSNTEDFSSFALSLGGSDFYSLDNNIVEGFTYRIGFAHQAAGEGDEEDETRYSASLQYEHDFTADLKGRLIGEIMHIDHLNGEGPHDRTYYTSGLGITWKQWNFGTTWTHIENDNPEEADEAIDGDLFQASIGYTFDIGIGIGVGYRLQDEEGEEKHRVGALISYAYEF